MKPVVEQAGLIKEFKEVSVTLIIHVIKATSKEVKKYFFLLKIRDQMKAAEHFYSIHKNEDYAFLC